MKENGIIEIKTLTASLLPAKSLEAFDKTINEALANGWNLIKRELITSVANDKIPHGVLYAELELRDTEKDEKSMQNAEIERLQKYNADVAFKHYNDGIREFAERVKNELSFGSYIQPDQIDNLVKEMTGGRE